MLERTALGIHHTHPQEEAPQPSALQAAVDAAERWCCGQLPSDGVPLVTDSQEQVSRMSASVSASVHGPHVCAVLIRMPARQGSR